MINGVTGSAMGHLKTTFREDFGYVTDWLIKAFGDLWVSGVLTGVSKMNDCHKQGKKAPIPTALIGQPLPVGTVAMQMRVVDPAMSNSQVSRSDASHRTICCVLTSVIIT